MPQYLPLPDGSSVTIREGESPLQAYERAKQMYPDAFGIKPRAPAEPTVGGQVKEFFKGLAPGAVGLLESAATGASALLPEETEKRAREGIASLAQAAKAPFAAAPGYEETIGRKFGEATGSIAPFLALGPFGVAGRIGMAGLGTGAGAGEARTRAEQEGATGEQRALATGLGSVVGISEMFAPMRILGRIDEPIKQGVVAGLKRVALAGGEEALQEAAAQAAQNLIAKGIYKPEQAIIEQVGESAAYGGAVGALAQGLLDLTLGRRARGTTSQDEIAKAREEAEAARAAEEARKAEPGYARQFVEDYEARKQQFVDARKALKKPGKDATPDVWDAYREQKSALDNLRESLAKDAKEYNKLRGQVAPEREQAGIQAELARLRGEAKGQAVLPGFETETVAPPVEPTAAPEFVDYAKQIRDLEGRLDELRTQAQQTTDLDQKLALNKQYEQAQTALTSAQQLAKQQAKEAVGPEAQIARLQKRMQTAEEQGDLPTQARIAEQLKALGVTDLSQIKTPEPAQAEIPLEPFKAKTMTKAEAAAQYYKPGAPDIEAQEAEALAEAERQRLQTTEDAERERRLLPETLALKRISDRPVVPVGGGMFGQGQISGAVDRLVEDFLRQRPQPTGRTISGGFAPLSAADDLRAQLNFARVTDNRELARDTIEQLKAMGEPETDVGAGGQMELGQVAKEAGVEGRQSTDVMKANRVTRASQAQLQSYDRLADFIQTVRESDQNVAQARKDTLRSAAEKLKDQVIGHALNEMDARRAQAGLPELTQQKKLEAVSRMSGVLNELITRGAGLFNIREVPAVVRSGVTVEGARTELPPPGQRLFNNLNAAATSLRGQVRDIIDQIGEIKAPEPRKAGPVRVISGLKLRGEEKERDVKGQFADAKARAKDDEQTFLSEAEAKFNNLSPEAQDLALEQARRVETGRGLDIPAQLEQELADLRRAGESETGQGELFAGTSERGAFRATTNNFIKYLDSNEVRKMQMEIAEQRKQADFQAKRAETIQKKLDEETAKQVAMIDKLTQPWFESPVATARRQFQNVVDKNKAAADLAKEINQKRTAVRTRIATIVQQVQDAHDKTSKNLKEVRDLYDYVAQQYLTRPGVKKFQISLDYYTNEVAKAEKAVATSQKALDAAKALQTRVLNDFAKDTIDNAIVREGVKAEKKIEEARLAVVKAQAEENAAKALLDRRKQEGTKGEKAVPAAEQVRLELEPKVTEVVRVYRDTSDPGVQAKVALERTNIGKWEGKYEEALTDQAKEIAVKNIEAAYNRMYEALNNAPLRRQVQMSADQIKAQEDFDLKQQQTAEALTKLFEDKTGAKLKMSKRKVEGVVRVKGGAPRAAIQEQSLAKQEAQFREEQATGEYAAATLEKLAEARAKREQLQAQIDYIDANKAEARTPARARQNAARTKAVEQRNKLDGQIKRLEVQQKGIEREAKLEKKAVKAVRQERTRMLREPGRLQEAVEGEEGGFEFSRGIPTQGQTVASLQKELDRAIGGSGLTARKVQLFDTVEDLLANREYGQDYTSEEIPSDAKAFVDPKTGMAFMFAKNIGKNEGLGVLLHEVGVHLGFRNLFNTAQYNALVKGVKGWLAKKDGSTEFQVAQKAKERVESAKTSKEQYDDELLAYTVEEAIKAGVKPSALRNGSPIQNWLSIVFDTLKRALSKFGINPKTLTAGDLVNMAYGAAQLEIRGTWHGSDAKFTAFDTKYAGTGEGAFDLRFVDESSLGAGPYVTPDKAYAEYYQFAVPFGKAANETGYGFKSYQDYRANDAKYMSGDRPYVTPVVDLQNIYESNLLTNYLQDVAQGGELDPNKNAGARGYLAQILGFSEKKVKAHTETLASREKRKANPDSIQSARDDLQLAKNQLKAAQTLDINKIKGLQERPAKGYLYRSLDALPREKVYSINSTARVGERPKIDALYKKYGEPFAAEDGKYTLNSLFYKMRRDLGIEKTIQELKAAGIEAIEQNNERGKYVERAYIDQAPEILAVDLEPVGPAKGLLFSRAPKYASPEMEAAGKALDPFVSNQRGMAEKVKANATGLAFETQLVDRFAGFERLAKYLPEHLGTQMMYYLRMYDQRMNMVAQAVAAGAPSIREVKRPDGKTERIIEAKEGANIKNVVETLKDANPMVGNAEAVNRLFTAYMAAIRADTKGFESLNFGEDVTREDLDKALSVVENNKELKDIFDKARGEYNEYNRNLIQFLVETGALSKKVAERLTAENDYIPFYREQNGVAQLLIGGEAPIRIGSIKEQPYLKELVGGDQPILDFLTSSVQNTNMLVDMGMRNLATKNAVFELVNLNAAKLVKGTPSGKDVVKFKIDGEDRYAVLATEKVKIGNKEFDTGVPADILVKGMEGIPTQMPFIFRAMAMPAQLLRKGVTLSPLYMARQLFRDSLAAPILSGADFTPVFGALKELKSATGKTLERRGITGGQQFKGTSEDLSMILREVASGKPGWMTALGKFEAAAMEADAATRRAQYNSYIQQGLSEMEATLMSLESMNFNKRGASPSVHIANALIPFFNAQIQGLNVLYKAMTGKMPFNDKLKIRQKMLQRGGMMAVAAMAYAVMMQDDEAYQNAEPDQKYGNWFVRLPGMDEAVRVPVPFEVGYIFKALPEAIVNTMLNEHGGEEAVKAFKQIVLQTIPGGSSYGIPQAMKPAIEVGLGKSFYTGRDILSAREKELLPEEQFRANTTEMAKAFGKLTGASPVLMEQLVRGYTGTMGLAFLQALSVGVPTGESPEKAVKRLSEYPVVGGAFQPNDAGGIINSVYERMNDAQKVEKTYEKLISEGRTSEAQDLLQRRGNDFMQAELAKEFKSNMNQLVQAERAIQAAAMPGDEKRKQLDEIRKLKIAVAKEIRDVADKTVSLSFSL